MKNYLCISNPTGQVISSNNDKYHILHQVCLQMQIRWAAADMVPGYLRDCNHLLNMIKCRGEE